LVSYTASLYFINKQTWAIFCSLMPNQNIICIYGDAINTQVYKQIQHIQLFTRIIYTAGWWLKFVIYAVKSFRHCAFCNARIHFIFKCMSLCKQNKSGRDDWYDMEIINGVSFNVFCCCNHYHVNILREGLETEDNLSLSFMHVVKDNLRINRDHTTYIHSTHALSLKGWQRYLRYPPWRSGFTKITVTKNSIF
jgi:hypothetical protein